MQRPYNPYLLHGGVFVPHYLLSTHELSHGAKLLYALLASKADSRGEVMLNVALAAAELGEEEHGIFRFMNELDSVRFIRTERHPAGTQLIRCSFLIPAWLLNINTGVKSDKSAPLTSRQPGTRSSSSPSFELLDDTNHLKQQMEEPGTGNHFDQDGISHPRSRYLLEDCYKYALACQQAGQRIKSPYRLAKALHKTGEQDEEIALFLVTGRKQSHTRAA